MNVQHKSGFERVLDRLVEGLGTLAAAGTVILVITTTTDVVARQFTDASIPGMLEFNQSMLVWIVFLGMAYTQKEGAQVRMTLVTDRVPDRVAHGMRIVAYALALLIITWMAYQSGLRAFDSFDMNETRQGLLRWPVAPWRAVLFVGLMALAIQLLRDLVRLVRGGRLREEATAI
ncbi:TRAP transporter small permease subunit [Brevibacterium jeotgali]|uniref:TRAP-type C4-dicarboxylate transport system, small permease component n=1 Tax=Brevibacterium jeotgali TaxID=1262550 RepID=A0A2H1L6X8_9MICO|nr:TRAP transporter small permease [Brevibacterium jeotgali]TWC02319.1 TRAP-type C4-dicarboxylate transport system permease small subunit [Brevibacterium jeotgali]SMY12629.1 TRAP-type C4-dicarboxylate transport system, small permease component [Brevibacterium jeotgali]